MADPPILTLTDVTLGFGGRPLFAGVSAAVTAQDRLALVGRNGAGKSTLLKLMAGLVEADGGGRFAQPGKTISYLPQDPDPTGFASLGDYAAADLLAEDRWKAEAAMDGLKVAPGIDPTTASGGERRRAALARLMAAEPDLMLLDEPTNHLDIAAIEWLEAHLAAGRTGFVLISHDRRFLSALTHATLWIDRGTVRRAPEGFAGFEAWRDKVWQEEAQADAKREKLIARETEWAAEGISARRTRNQGRLRRLRALRAERADAIRRQGPAAMAFEASGPSGKLVVEAIGISKRFGGVAVLRDFSIRIGRGERVALVGPNGAGKTTLLKLLTGQLAPDQGRIRLGTNLETAVFDQNRAALDTGKSLWESLTEDSLTRVSGRSDQVMVRGRPRHVIAYLKEFLFDERQARGPVSALSGGERARLLLARIMAGPSNLLVLDEPTNDLDVETLDLLQELIAEFEGTVLLVSHDRDFLDRVASSTVVMAGDGNATVYAGGWSDYRAQARLDADGAVPVAAAAKPAKPARPVPQAGASAAVPKKLSYAQERRLAQLPGEIERLAAEIAKLEEFLADPALFNQAPVKFAKASEGLTQRQTQLAAAEEEWLELEALREALTA
ncbi:MAG: ABC-F family ATP-binding cassette domain-containing protein, partial [Pseudomonadota bacterium]